MALSLKPQHLSRYRDIARLLVKHGGADLVRHAGLDAALDGTEPAGDPAAAAQLADDLEAMGPTFVKLGQLLSTRADLLPRAHLEALARLQDEVEPIPFAVVEETVERELGVRISRGFRSFDHEPLAAASLGQVHRAVLRDGRPVAVKVQRPDIRDRIREDMDAIEEIASFADAHTDAGRRYGFASMVEEFRRSLSAELDYRREAAHLATLARNLAGHDLIVVPQPVDGYTTSRVLTMDFVEGRKITSLGPLAQLEIDGGALADALFRAYLDQILRDGFFHADPHPGNLLLTDDGRLALIDLGMVGRLSESLRDELLKMLLAVGEGDGEAVATVCLDVGHRLEGFDRDGFVSAVVDLVHRTTGSSLGGVQAGAVLGELSRISGVHGLRAPAELTMLAKTLLNLDEVARTLDPAFRPDEAIRRHGADLMRSRVLRSLTPGSVLAASMEAKEFVERLPGRVNKVFDALAEGRLTLNIQGIDEAELMRGVQKLANRLTMGVVLAALVIGAAMTMRVDAGPALWGYPALSVVLFVLAALGGIALVASIAMSDLPQRPQRFRRFRKRW